jgi:hypothetical protein
MPVAIDNCTLRDGKKPWYVCWAMRWSVYAALKEQQLDEWQLYVEGRERSHGTFDGRRDGRSRLCWKRNSLTGGGCTLWDE